jgi:hypothetical protein
LPKKAPANRTAFQGCRAFMKEKKEEFCASTVALTWPRRILAS